MIASLIQTLLGRAEDFRDRGRDVARDVGRRLPSRSELADLRDRGVDTARDVADRLPSRSQVRDWRDQGIDTAHDLADRLPSRSKLTDWRDRGYEAVSDLADRLPSRSELMHWRDRGIDRVRDLTPSLHSVRGPDAMQVAQGLGWFSIVLGATELLGGRTMASRAGLTHRTGLLRFFGLRDIATGVAILARPHSPNGMWLRAAGGAMDAAALSTGLRRNNPKKATVQVALVSVLMLTALDVLVARQLEDEG